MDSMIVVKIFDGFTKDHLVFYTSESFTAFYKKPIAYQKESQFFIPISFSFQQLFGCFLTIFH